LLRKLVGFFHYLSKVSLLCLGLKDAWEQYWKYKKCPVSRKSEKLRGEVLGWRREVWRFAYFGNAGSCGVTEVDCVEQQGDRE
jgi:hypothetical protein